VPGGFTKAVPDHPNWPHSPTTQTPEHTKHTHPEQATLFEAQFIGRRGFEVVLGRGFHRWFGASVQNIYVIGARKSPDTRVFVKINKRLTD